MCIITMGMSIFVLSVNTSVEAYNLYDDFGVTFASYICERQRDFDHDATIPIVFVCLIWKRLIEIRECPKHEVVGMVIFR